MLANKGGGTLVVTGPQKKTKSTEKPESPDTKLRIDKFKLFAGSGHALGGGGNADRSKSRLLSLGEPQAKKPKPADTLEKESKNFKKDDEMCKCSVCNQKIPREEMGMHLEDCSGLQNVFNNSIVDIEDEEESENVNGETQTACPICNVQIEGDINAHVDECLNSSGVFNMFDEPEMLPDNDNSPVFVREYKVPKPIKVEDDVQIVEREDEARVACPLCGMRFGVSKIDEHVNQCLDSE